MTAKTDRQRQKKLEIIALKRQRVCKKTTRTAVFMSKINVIDDSTKWVSIDDRCVVIIDELVDRRLDTRHALVVTRSGVFATPNVNADGRCNINGRQLLTTLFTEEGI